MTYELKGRIDSGNAAQVEKELLALLAGGADSRAELDAAGLDYISSAGLRVLLRVRRSCPEVRITNVRPEVYEILEMTGFTEIMTVEKAYRVVSVEGCEIIGQGAKGTIYRIDQDNVVKVYNDADALESIQHEREMAKTALILGIPTAISYDVVRVGEGYGSVFELLNARSFSKILAQEPEKMDWCVEEYVAMLKRIHSTVVPAGKMPDIRPDTIRDARILLEYLPEDAGKKLLAMTEAVPHDDHMVHGDYHTKNLELQNGEVLLIDMDTLSTGHPIFDLAFMFTAFIGFTELDPDVIRKFQGFDAETGRTFWRKSLAAYLGTRCEAKIREVEDKAAVIGYAYLLARAIRHNVQDTEQGKKEFAYRKQRLLELLERTDTLTFTPNELEIGAEAENLEAVQAFVDEKLEAAGCSMKAQMQVDVAVEEVFINIASYAYAPGRGKAWIRVETAEAPAAVTITFTDRGMPYDPLSREDPDVTLPAEQRDAGGLGVYMTKKLMDEAAYEYRDGQNILTLKKKL